MLAGIPGPGFLIFRAGRVIEVPRTPLEAIAVATGISRKYLQGMFIFRMYKLTYHNP